MKVGKGRAMCSSRERNLKLLSPNSLSFEESKICHLGKVENGGKSSERIENNVGKGKTARYEQFFSFPHSVCKRLALQTCKKTLGLFRKGLRCHLYYLAIELVLQRWNRALALGLSRA